MRFPLAILAALLAAAALAQGDGWKVADSVRARVDDTVITLSQLRAEGALAKIEGEKGPLTEVELLRRLIRRRLIVAEATKLRMTTSPEEAKAGVAKLAESAGGEEELSKATEPLGVTRADLEKRAGEIALVGRYLGFRRESTYVSESEVRSYVAKNPDAAGSGPIAQVRDEVRKLLASEKHEAELDKWIDRQLGMGRVRIIPVAESTFSEVKDRPQD